MDELEPILERSGAAGYQESDTDIHIACELAEDVRDAIIEYQVCPNLSAVPRTPR